MNEVHQVFQRVGDPAAFLQIIAAVKELRAAHPQFNGELGPHSLPNGGKHLPGEADPVLQGAAVPC